MTDNPILDQALECAERGWPVFPCKPGLKIPATEHGYLDASTDLAQIHRWFARHPDRNLAVATGAPGPDVLDIDRHGSGSGFPALYRLRDAGLLDEVTENVFTPSGGVHIHLAGSAQRCGHLPAFHIDFLSVGGYALLPPSRFDGVPYHQLKPLGGHAGLDWAAATRLLAPDRQPPPAATPERTGRPNRRPSPVDRDPAARQPQRRPVLGRQPRSRTRSRRRPQPSGRCRPPRRTRRRGDHPHPALRRPHRPPPGPARATRSPGRRRPLT